MPAASSKAEIKASLEVNEPIKQALAVVDKKVRNLEKRKLKLDAYKAKISGGETLAKDQVAAIQHYDEVITSLECARELQKQFLAINTEAEKLQKKQAKRDKMEKQAAEIKRTRDILAVQNLLDNMGSEPVRHDFQTGKHGSVVLSEENISQLDELYKLINPTRDGPRGYNESLNSAAEHIVNLLDAREKEVTGTTYKELKELLDQISGCGYFDNFPYNDDKEDGKDNEYVLVEGQGPKSEDDLDSYQQEVEPEIPMPHHIQSQSNKLIEEVRSQEVESQELKKTAAEADLFFSSTQAYQHHAPPQAAQPPQSQRQRQRPIQEIVSSVQGSFNFLQESTIDMESPHMDPAVVAAHPMRTTSPLPPHSTSSQTPDISNLSHSQSSFTTGYRDQQQLISENPAADQTTASLLAVVAAAQQVATSVQQDYSGSSFGQTHLSQSLQQSDRLFSVQDSNSMLGQSVSDGTMSQFEMPPSIPMPPSHNQTQENQQQSQGEKKPFTMNPNAGEFQSLIYQNSSSGDSESQKSDLQISTDINQTGFQDAGFNSGGFHQQSQRGRSNYRGGRGGGGRGGGSGGTMTNGFPSRPRGGSRGGRGGSGFGYQRSDYHPDGYQGYNSSGYNNNNYQKRGGGAGNTRGGNSHGSGGGMRAVGRGGPRGGSRGGPDVSRGGGFGKPNFNQQSAPMVQE